VKHRSPSALAQVGNEVRWNVGGVGYGAEARFENESSAIHSGVAATRGRYIDRPVAVTMKIENITLLR
jgi:hypothetical protein